MRNKGFAIFWGVRGGGGGGQIRFIMGDVQVANRGIELCFIRGISVILILR